VRRLTRAQAPSGGLGPLPADARGFAWGLPPRSSYARRERACNPTNRVPVDAGPAH
jgi:hypothetical protein